MADRSLSIDPLISGADLAALIQREAALAGISLSAFLGPISNWPKKWLDQLRNAEHPRGATISRIEALIRGELVPSAPPNNFWKNGAQKRTYHAARHRGDPRGELPPVVSRDPCSRCGTRADIGCRHQVLEARVHG